VATIFEVHNAFEKLHHAPSALGNILEEIQILKAVLGRIKLYLETHPDAIESMALEDVFILSVEGAKATLECLDTEFGELKDRTDWKAKIIVFWKDDTMRRLLEQLERKRQV
jgi:hypothetical protein